MTAYPKYPRHESSKGLRAHLRFFALDSPRLRYGGDKGSQ